MRALNAAPAVAFDGTQFQIVWEETGVGGTYLQGSTLVWSTGAHTAAAAITQGSNDLTPAIASDRAGHVLVVFDRGSQTMGVFLP